jgi:hypothetical protein
MPPTPIRRTRRYRPSGPSEPTGPAIVRLSPHAFWGGLRRQPGPESCQVAALTTATSVARAWMKSAPCPLRDRRCAAHRSHYSTRPGQPASSAVGDGDDQATRSQVKAWVGLQERVELAGDVADQAASDLPGPLHTITVLGKVAVVRVAWCGG